MNIQHYNRIEKLRNAAKIVAGVIGGGGALLFIITLVAAGSYGGITFWVFLAAAIPCTIYIFLAWLAYHLINTIADTFDNTEKILKKIDLLQSSATDAKSNENTLAVPIVPATPIAQIYNTVTEPTTAQNITSAPISVSAPIQTSTSIPASLQKPTSAQKLSVKPKPAFDLDTNDEIKISNEENAELKLQANVGSNAEQSNVLCKGCGFSYARLGNFCPQCGTKNDMKLNKN
jgi:hypothetical protein